MEKIKITLTIYSNFLHIFMKALSNNAFFLDFIYFLHPKIHVIFSNTLALSDVTQALLTNYPDLKVICAPTTVGIAAAAKVLQDQGSSVKLTGLGLPSEMAEYIGDDDAHSCPYMFLWNPIDLGRLGAYTSIALVKGDAIGAAGEKFTAGSMGEYEIVTAGDGGTEIILGAPFKFDPSSIEEWKVVY